MEENNLNNEPNENIAPVYEPAPAVEEAPKTEEVKEEPKKSGKGMMILIPILLLLIGGGIGTFFIINNGDKKEEDEKKVVTEKKEYKSDYALKGNDLEEFDLQFLRLENKKENVVYSPLSIKYALAMLNEGTDGTSKEQIKALIGDYKAKKYVNSKNLSLANAFFIKSSISNSIMEDFKTALKTKYDAEIILDEFKDPYQVNNWVKEKTLKLIDKIIDKISDEDIFYIINALAIDMEWENPMLIKYNLSGKATEFTISVDYDHTDFSWYTDETPKPGKFENVKEEISTMGIAESVNRFDPLKKYGSQDAYKKVIKEYYEACYKEHPDYKYEGLNIDDDVKDAYDAVVGIAEKQERNTDFLFYVDEDVKVFAKDLKKYDGTTLQYVGIMPVKDNLETFVKNTNKTKIKDYISKLVDFNKENFEEGYITVVKGTIPKFKYDYTLDLEGDLKKLGVTDIFDSTKANLSKITKDQVYINKALHKANIEFTQYGIKAAAATLVGGAGNLSGGCNYIEKLPTKEINITFDKPYLYIIRDKDTGEVWFTGQVYNPLAWSADPDYQS